MQSGSNERRIREVWETTQENLETAVGTAYSGWNSFYDRHLEPALEAVGACCQQCLCISSGPRALSNNRRGSMDIFFDMYDDDEAFGRDELERLLSSANDNDDGDGGGDHDDGTPSYRATQQPSAAAKMWTYLTGEASHQPHPHQYGRASTQPQPSLWTRLFPRKVRYHPSTNDLQITRARSGTKSSTHSSDTYRSRRDLFSDSEEPDEDAQMVSDNFAAELAFKRTNSDQSVGQQQQQQNYKDDPDDDGPDPDGGDGHDAPHRPATSEDDNSSSQNSLI